MDEFAACCFLFGCNWSDSTASSDSIDIDTWLSALRLASMAGIVSRTRFNGPMLTLTPAAEVEEAAAEAAAEEDEVDEAAKEEGTEPLEEETGARGDEEELQGLDSGSAAHGRAVDASPPWPGPGLGSMPSFVRSITGEGRAAFRPAVELDSRRADACFGRFLATSSCWNSAMLALSVWLGISVRVSRRRPVRGLVAWSVSQR